MELPIKPMRVGIHEQLLTHKKKTNFRANLRADTHCMSTLHIMQEFTIATSDSVAVATLCVLSMQITF